MQYYNKNNFQESQSQQGIHTVKFLQAGKIIHEERLKALHFPVTVNVNLELTVQVIGHSTAAWCTLTCWLTTENYEEKTAHLMCCLNKL